MGSTGRRPLALTSPAAQTSRSGAPHDHAPRPPPGGAISTPHPAGGDLVATISVTEARAAEVSSIRVASVPADHPYVRHLGAPGDRSVVRLGDERAPGQRGWWPPRMLEPEWVEANRDSFDLFHVQFGFDGRHPEQLRELFGLLREHRKPVVATVHDLRNPNHDEPELHDEQLRAVVDAAAALITLTGRAAASIGARFGRRVEVIPHPHVVPLDRLAGRYRERPRKPGPTVVGIHLKSMRPNMVGPGLLAALEPMLADPGMVLRVDVHEEIWDPQAPAFRADLRCRLEHLDRTASIDLRVHPYFSDDELYEYLRQIDVAVLPYRFGTHSGWLEACRDLGTAVVAPSCGCYDEQGADAVFGLDEERGLDAASLRFAVARAAASVSADEVHPLGHELRLRERLRIAARHREIYERVLDR